MIDWKTQSRRFLPTILLIAAVLVVVVLVIPIIFDYIATHQRRSASQKLLQELDQTQVVIENIEPDKIKRLERILPPLPNEPELLVEIEALAVRSGVILIAVDFGQSSDGKLKLTQDIKGRYSNLKKYLSNLEESIRIMDVVSLELTPPDQGSLYQLKLGTVAYYRTNEDEDEDET